MFVLRLVLARTHESPFICPFEADVLEASTEAIASALIESAINQYAGVEVPHQLLPHRLSTP